MLARGSGLETSVFELGACGVRRISLGSALIRAGLGPMLRAAREIHDAGTFSFGADALPYPDLNKLMEAGTRPANSTDLAERG